MSDRSPPSTPAGSRRSSGHAPRSSTARWSATAAGSARVVVDDQDLVALAHLEAPVADQRRERVRVDHGASSSGKCSATCSRSESRTNRRSSLGGHPVAARAAPSGASMLEPGDRPRDGEPLEQQLGRALPASSRSSPPASVSAYRVARRRSASRAARARCRRGRGTRTVAGGELARRALASRSASAGPRRGCRGGALRAGAATSPVTGSTWPAHTVAGSQRGELADRGARLLGVVVNAGWGTCAGLPARPAADRWCRCSPRPARAGRTRGTARSGRARGRADRPTRKPATSSPSSTVPATFTAPPSQVGSSRPAARPAVRVELR